MPVRTLEEAKSFAQTWMTDMGYFGREVTPCPEGFNFMLEGAVPNKIPFLIIQPKESADILVVLATVRITESSFNSLSKMKEEDRDEFLWNLQKELILLPPTYSFDPTFEETSIPKGIQFTKEVYYDDLTKGKLAEAVHYTTRGALWVVLTFKRKFNPNKEVEQYAE